MIRNAILGTLLMSICLGQTATLKNSTLSNMAISSAGSSTLMKGTVGQLVAGKVQSDNVILTSGIWGTISKITLSLDQVLPNAFSISNAYPNPFNPTVNIDFEIPEVSDIDILIYNILGQEVYTHTQHISAPGKYQFQWHGTTKIGTPISSGIYFINIHHNSKIYKQKITLVK